MALGIFIGDREGENQWVKAMGELMPGLEARAFPDWDPFEEIEYVLVWEAPAELLRPCVNLKGIISMGAGVEHLTEFGPALPQGVPIVRMADPALVDCMTEYVVMNVLIHHRSVLDYLDQQRHANWWQLPAVSAMQRRVGFMGLGNMARPASQLLSSMGFDIAAWVRSAREEDCIDTYVGAGNLADFLARSDILVCLLPSTRSTEGLLDAETLSLLPQGAVIINAGRGSLIVEQDLLAALDSGHLSGASLDVFASEPLPAGSPLWSHPRVIITPHMASPSMIESAAPYVKEVIGQIERGQLPEHLVNMGQGY